jgi:hypothetical protein
MPGHTGRLRLHLPFRGHCVTGLCFRENPVYRNEAIERHVNHFASFQCQSSAERANMTSASKTLENYQNDYVGCVIDQAERGLRELHVMAKSFGCYFAKDGRNCMLT